MTDDFLGYLPLQEAAGRCNLTYSQLHKLIQYGRVRSTHDGRYVMVDVASLEDWLPPPGWAWLGDAAKQYKLSYAQLRRLVKHGLVRARKSGFRWQVDLSSLQAAIEVPPGWITAREAAKRLGMTDTGVVKRIEAGLLPGRKHDWYWIVEEAAVEEQIPPAGWITVQEAVERTGMADSTIIQRIQAGRIRCRKAGGRWYVEPASIVSL